VGEGNAGKSYARRGALKKIGSTLSHQWLNQQSAPSLTLLEYETFEKLAIFLILRF